MKSYSAPTRHEIDAALVRTQVLPQYERYFFAHLANPLWVTPLKDAGAFADPPRPIVNDRGTRFPPWPLSQYLARMASEAPDDVTKAILSFETDNWSIAQDVLDAAKVLPSKHAVKLLPRITDFVRKRVLLSFDLKGITELIVKLAADGMPEPAFDLAQVAFDVERVELRNPRRDRDEYWYIECLPKVTNALMSLDVERTLLALLEWIDIAIGARRGDDEGMDDGSAYWRPAIEEHAQNPDYDFTATLVGHLRGLLEQLIRNNEMALDSILSMISQRRFLVYKRMQVHLLNEFAERDRDRVRQVMMDRTLVDDHRYKHEYAMLLEKRFGLLEATERETWLDWIREGPDMEEFEERARHHSIEPTQELRKATIERWQFEKLWWVRDHLEGQWRESFLRLRDQYGVPELPDMNVYFGEGGRDDESPYTVAHLETLTFEQVAALLRDWTEVPERRRDGSYAGLERAFTEYVERNVESAAANAAHLIGAKEWYIRALLRTSQSLIRKPVDIKIDSVLELCEWVLTQPVDEPTEPERVAGLLTGKDWQYAHDAIIEFLRALCENDAPLEYRERLWALLAQVAKDRALAYASAFEAGQDPRTRDFSSLCLNTPRSRALHAIFEYARWIGRNVMTRADGHEIIQGGFDKNMPEVRCLLEERLSDSDDNEFAVRAVFGWHWALLYWIDKEWLRSQADAICDLKVYESDPSVAFGWSAWNTFLMVTRPHRVHYEILEWQFAYAVQQACDPHLRVGGDSYRDPFLRLGQHLMILYGRGDIELSDKSVLGQFLTQAQPKIRSHAIASVGSSLRGDEELPEEILERFGKLWEWYWRQVGREDDPDVTRGLFGSWFTCGRFDARWAIRQLEVYTDYVNDPHASGLILDELAKVARADVGRAVGIVSNLVQGDVEGWEIYGAKKELRSVLYLGMVAANDVREATMKIIDLLGRRGYVEFRDLLEVPAADEQ